MEVKLDKQQAWFRYRMAYLHSEQKSIYYAFLSPETKIQRRQRWPAAGNSHEQAIFGTARYHCIAITTGYSDRGIWAKDGELSDENLYLFTCVPGGEEFEIYIVALER